MLDKQNRGDITTLLQRWEAGDRTALDSLMEIVNNDLHRMAVNVFSGESPGNTLNPTGLVNECYLRLVDQNRVQWENRIQFFALSARIMRRILIDRARRRGAAKRVAVSIPWADRQIAPSGFINSFALGEALAKLHEIGPRQAEIVELRFLAGLTVDETAKAIGISPRTVKLDWRMARAFLITELRRGSPSSPPTG